MLQIIVEANEVGIPIAYRLCTNNFVSTVRWVGDRVDHFGGALNRVTKLSGIKHSSSISCQTARHCLSL